MLGHLAGRQAGSIFQSWESILSYLMVCTHLHHRLSLIHLLAYFKDSSSSEDSLAPGPDGCMHSLRHRNPDVCDSALLANPAIDTFPVPLQNPHSSRPVPLEQCP